MTTKNKRKLRILWCGEAAYLNTGYGVYDREVLSRLHETGKYEIAELASYGHWNDKRRLSIPWTFYGNLPDTPDDEDTYLASNLNQFGCWKFEETCLDFRPDVVWDIRDWWMMEFAEHSPFRDFYKWVIMPTVDSAPLPDRWVYSYRNADALCAYSEFGRDVLEGKEIVVPGTAWNTEIQNARIGKVFALAPPAADFDVLKPVRNKAQHKSMMAFKDKVLIVGTVMRNQKRKMYAELLRSFRIMLEENPALADRTFLYIHTSYPDIGWDMPRLLREEHLGHKVLFTYVCSHCGNVQPLFFQDARTTCLNCGRPKAELPSTQAGVSKEQLSDILNVMDVYVQYSICEGFGMPQLEAAACGVPIMAVDYSAMSSVLRNVKGIPIKPLCVTRESETHAYRAVPDNRDLITQLSKFLRQPEAMRLKRGRETYKAARKHYSWDKTAKVWEKYFDSLEVPDQAKTWDSPARIHQPDLKIPQGLSYEQLVTWGFANIWGRPDMVTSYAALKMMRDLNYGFAITDTGDTKFNEGSLLANKNHYLPFTAEDAVHKMIHYNQLDTKWEERRTARLAMSKPLFIANKKEASNG